MIAMELHKKESANTMVKKFEDQVELEVRRRLRSYLASGGVDQGRIELEVLYELPPEFVRAYSELHEMTLNTNPSGSNSGPGSGDQRKAAVSRASYKKDEMHARTIGVAGGGGKRHSERRTPIRSLVALEERRKLDRRLVRAVEDAIRAARKRADDSTSEKADTLGQTAGKGKERKDCPECGRGMMKNWVRCPFH